MHLAGRDIPFPELTSASRISLRSAGASDRRFLAELFATSRAEELTLTGWDDAQKQAFCELQFRLQQADYSARFPDACHRIILREDEPVGRVWTADEGDHVLVVDIAILPGHRGEGVGAIVLATVFGEAAASDLPVRLSARRANAPAIALYRRLGFAVQSEDDVFVLLERPPGP